MPLIAIVYIKCNEADHAEQPYIYLVETSPDRTTSDTFGCNDRLVAVTARNVHPKTHIAGLISDMINTPGSDSLYNAVYNPGMRIRVEKNRPDSTLIVHLDGEFKVGGMCDHPRIERQLRKTVLQFEPWKRATFYINKQPLNSYTNLGERGDSVRVMKNDT